jgi:hypothetical protein
VRARYLIRDMANGDVTAWNRAELKLSQSDIKPQNRQDLSDAMATLLDPRQPRRLPEPDGRRYAITVHAAQDWGDEPPVVDTSYKFDSQSEATVEAFREMWRQYCLGAPRNYIGAYVISNDGRDTSDGDPSVEVLLTLPHTKL